jgi:hypothetical protein
MRFTEAEADDASATPSTQSRSPSTTATPCDHRRRALLKETPGTPIVGMGIVAAVLLPNPMLARLSQGSH